MRSRYIRIMMTKKKHMERENIWEQKTYKNGVEDISTCMPMEGTDVTAFFDAGEGHLMGKT